MQIQSPFAALTPTVDGDILGVVASTHDDYTISRLSALIPNRSVSGIRQSLDRLVAHGLVASRRIDRTWIYRLNDGHLLASAAREIANTRSRLVEQLRDRIAEWPVQPRYAALYGSAARGEMTVDSDLDILVVLPPIPTPTQFEVEEDWDLDFSSLTDAAGGWTGNDVQIVELSIEDVTSESRRPLLESVVRDGVVLAGDGEWLRRQLSKGAAA